MAISENLILREAELTACRPIGHGDLVRAFCPFHGSDHQRSLSVNRRTGHFKCFSCGAWGYMAEKRAEWLNEHKRERQRDNSRLPKRPPGLRTSIAVIPPPKPVSSEIADLLRGFQSKLRGSLGEKYLAHRRIPIDIAEAHGIGYAPPCEWPRKPADWKHGRLVFPHTDPAGNVVNLYGRAVGSSEKVPKELRHDHLPGRKGYFNAATLATDFGPLFVCEAPFDALSLIAAGHPRSVAIFGVNGWRWEWAQGIPKIFLTLDADEAGQKGSEELAREGTLRGKRMLIQSEYGGFKDVNEAWAAGKLNVGSWTVTEEGTGPSQSVQPTPPAQQHPPARVGYAKLSWFNWPRAELDLVQHNVSGQNRFGQRSHAHPLALIKLDAWKEASWDLQQVRWYRSSSEAQEVLHPWVASPVRRPSNDPAVCGPAPAAPSPCQTTFEYEAPYIEEQAA